MGFWRSVCRWFVGEPHVPDERLRLRVEEGQRVLQQALQDQADTDFPGCCMGLMHCLDAKCSCRWDRPSRAFILARCHRIRSGMDLES